jgi:hypothetical protein
MKKEASRIEKIRAALRKLGPSTTGAIARATGITEKEVGGLIRDARKKAYPGTRFRKAGKTREGCINMSWLYELSDEPDAVVSPVRFQPSRRKAIKHPGMTRQESEDKKRRAALLRQIKPFRDPFTEAFYGRAAA